MFDDSGSILSSKQEGSAEELYKIEDFFIGRRVEQKVITKVKQRLFQVSYLKGKDRGSY